jgi:hypothetical protein
MARWQPAERNARFVKARAAGLPVVVSEGDSWFDYPMYRNIIDRIDDKRRFALKRLEFSGDTVAHMIGDGTVTSGVQSLETVITAERPRFLLFSGGGNDMVGEEFTDGVKVYDATQTAAWHLDTPVWRVLKRGVEADFRTRLRPRIRFHRAVGQARSLRWAECGWPVGLAGARTQEYSGRTHD